jgi:hypothetical protein
VPIGQYVLEVKGNSEFQSSTKVINLVNEEEEDTITVFVGIKPRIDTDVEIQFYQLLGNEERSVEFRNIEAKAILIPEFVEDNEN